MVVTLLQKLQFTLQIQHKSVVFSRQEQLKYDLLAHQYWAYRKGKWK